MSRCRTGDWFLRLQFPQQSLISLLPTFTRQNWYLRTWAPWDQSLSACGLSHDHKWQISLTARFLTFFAAWHKLYLSTFWLACGTCSRAPIGPRSLQSSRILNCYMKLSKLCWDESLTFWFANLEYYYILLSKSEADSISHLAQISRFFSIFITTNALMVQSASLLAGFFLLFLGKSACSTGYARLGSCFQWAHLIRRSEDPSKPGTTEVQVDGCPHIS